MCERSVGAGALEDQSQCFPPTERCSQCNSKQMQTLVRLARMHRARARPEATTVKITRAKQNLASACSRLACTVARSFPTGALTVLSISRRRRWASSLLPSTPFVSSAIVIFFESHQKQVSFFHERSARMLRNSVRNSSCIGTGP